MSRNTGATGRLAVAVTALSILLLGASGRVDSQEGLASLLRVESPEGRFRVQLPQPLPAPSRDSRMTLLGGVDEVRYAFDWEQGRVSVEIYDIPRVATLLFPSSLLLGQAADGVVEDMEARELERHGVERGPHPGQVVTYQLPGTPAAIERALIVLAESRLYIVVVTSAPGAALGAVLERVIDSFHVLP